MYFTKNKIHLNYIVAGLVIILAVGGFIGFTFASYSDSAEEEEQGISELPWEEESREANNQEGEEELSFYVVDVKGEIMLPGVYTVDAGERVHDVIEKAGGFTEDAFREGVNLAERCYDEMVISIPKEGDEGDLAEIVTSSIHNGSSDGILLNQATSTELTELPGIGPAKAEAIVTFREENGAFQKIEDVVKVPGIGDKTLEAIQDLLILR